MSLGLALARCDDLGGVAEALLTHGPGVLGSEVLTLAVRDPDDAGLIAHHGSGVADHVAGRWTSLPVDRSTVIGAAYTTGEVVSVDIDQIARSFPAVVEDARRLGLLCYRAVPLVAEGEIEGVLGIGFDTRHPPATSGSATDLSDLVAAVLHRVRRAQSTRALVSSFQQVALPTRPWAPLGWDVDTCYVPSRRGLTVGGDWFDAFALDDDRFVVAVGDVVGHGPVASATMSVLRTATRVICTPADDDPSALLDRLSALSGRLDLDRHATVVLAVVERDTGRARVASAGHLPPIVRRHGGTARLVELASGPPVGCGIDGRCAVGEIDLGAGDELVLFTDGLVERTGEVIDDGLARLAEALGTTPEVRSRRLVDRLTDHLDADDVAILRLRRAFDLAA